VPRRDWYPPLHTIVIAAVVVVIVAAGAAAAAAAVVVVVVASLWPAACPCAGPGSESCVPGAAGEAGPGTAAARTVRVLRAGAGSTQHVSCIQLPAPCLFQDSAWIRCAACIAGACIWPLALVLFVQHILLPLAQPDCDRGRYAYQWYAHFAWLCGTVASRPGGMWLVHQALIHIMCWHRLCPTFPGWKPAK
jgi:hypothetical protein